METSSSSQCIRISCSSPPLLARASFKLDHSSVVGAGFNFEFGNRVQYRCDDGYVFGGGSSNGLEDTTGVELECGPSGTWIGNIQECEQVRQH